MNAPLVYFVDDDPEVLSTIMSMAEAIGITPKGFSSGNEFLATLPSLQESLVFVDVRMKGADGLEVLKQVRERWFSAPVVMISGSSDIAIAVEAMRRGATDFVEKPISLAELEKTINDATSQGKNDTAADQHPQAKSNLLKLTNRELQVARLIVDGASNREVGEQLGISQRTAEVHRANLIKKMQVNSFAEFVKACVIGKIDEL